MNKVECMDHGGAVTAPEHERLLLSRRDVIAAAFSTVAIATVAEVHGRDSGQGPVANCGYEYAYAYVY